MHWYQNLATHVALHNNQAQPHDTISTAQGSVHARAWRRVKLEVCVSTILNTQGLNDIAKFALAPAACLRARLPQDQLRPPARHSTALREHTERGEHAIAAAVVFVRWCASCWLMCWKCRVLRLQACHRDT